MQEENLHDPLGCEGHDMRCAYGIACVWHSVRRALHGEQENPARSGFVVFNENGCCKAGRVCAVLHKTLAKTLAV